MKTPKFRDIEDLFDYIPEEELILTLHLRNLIKSVLPEVKEKLSYNVPFYALNTSLCYLWPASILWGNRKTFNGVRLGFTKGYLLTDPQNLLDKTNRKQMFAMDLITTEDFKKQQHHLKSLLLNAAEVDRNYQRIKGRTPLK